LFFASYINEDTLINGVGVPPTQSLYYRFFLAVGDEVYANRKYILDKLAQMPNGDKYFQILMRSLAWFERGKKDPSDNTPTSFKELPQTIKEARSYFINK